MIRKYKKLMLLVSLMCMSSTVPAFSCRTSSQILDNIGNINSTMSVALSPTITSGGNLIVDLGRELECRNDGDVNPDFLYLLSANGFSSSLMNYSGSIEFLGRTYPLPILNGDVDLMQRIPLIKNQGYQPFNAKLILSPVNSAGGVIIRPGDVISVLEVGKTGGGNMGMFRMQWAIVAANEVTMPIGGCDVSARDVTVNLPSYDATSNTNTQVPLTVNCPSGNKTLSYTLDGTTVDASRQIFRNSAASSPAYGIGINMLDKNNNVITANNPVLLGAVGASLVDLELKARYVQTGGQVTAGTVQSIIGVTFTYP